MLEAFAAWLSLTPGAGLPGSQLADHPLTTAALEGLASNVTFDQAVEAMVELIYSTSSRGAPDKDSLALVSRLVPAVRPMHCLSISRFSRKIIAKWMCQTCGPSFGALGMTTYMPHSVVSYINYDEENELALDYLYAFINEGPSSITSMKDRRKHAMGKSMQIGCLVQSMLYAYIIGQDIQLHHRQVQCYQRLLLQTVHAGA